MPKCAKIGYVAGSLLNLFGKGMNGMTEKLQRTEQVITEAELRTMLDDEGDDSFADLISKGVTQARAALGVASRTAIGASGGTQTGHHPMKTTRDMRSCSS